MPAHDFDGYTDADFREDGTVYKIRTPPVIVPVADVLQITYLAVPALRAGFRTKQTIDLTFSALQGEEYLLQFSDSLSTRSWSTFTNFPAGTARDLGVTLPTSGEQRFFRLEVP